MQLLQRHPILWAGSRESDSDFEMVEQLPSESKNLERVTAKNFAGIFIS